MQCIYLARQVRIEQHSSITCSNVSERGCNLTASHAVQGFAAFKLNVQAAQEDQEKLARAAGKFKNQRMGLAFETWKQHTQHTQLLQSCLTKAVAALVNRSLRAGFTAWRDAAALKKQHSQKVYKQIKCLQPSMSQHALMQEECLRKGNS